MRKPFVGGGRISPQEEYFQMSTKTSSSFAKTGARPSQKQRRELRYKFSAIVELLEDGSGDRIEGYVRNLSLKGCYVDMNCSVPAGTVARIRITKGTNSFEAQVRVVFSHAGKGMGLLFTSIAPIYIPTLVTWIASSRETSWLAANRRKSQRIHLQIPVRVSGPKGGALAFEETSHTTSISANGALVLLATPVTKGRPLILSNIQTGDSVECIVTYIGKSVGSCLQIGLSFVFPNQSFWPVSFPPEDWSPHHEYAKNSPDRPTKS
jgi:hypothetical protein